MTTRFNRRAAIVVVLLATLFALPLFAPTTFAEDGWGHLRGQFVFDGTPPKRQEINTGGKANPEEPLLSETADLGPIKLSPKLFQRERPADDGSKK